MFELCLQLSALQEAAHKWMKSFDHSWSGKLQSVQKSRALIDFPAYKPNELCCNDKTFKKHKYAFHYTRNIQFIKLLFAIMAITLAVQSFIFLEIFLMHGNFNNSTYSQDRSFFWKIPQRFLALNRPLNSLWLQWQTTHAGLAVEVSYCTMLHKLYNFITILST